jgi:hypothetical protein
MAPPFYGWFADFMASCERTVPCLAASVYLVPRRSAAASTIHTSDPLGVALTRSLSTATGSMRSGRYGCSPAAWPDRFRPLGDINQAAT